MGVLLDGPTKGLAQDFVVMCRDAIILMMFHPEFLERCLQLFIVGPQLFYKGIEHAKKDVRPQVEQRVKGPGVIEEVVVVAVAVVANIGKRLYLQGEFHQFPAHGLGQHNLEIIVFFQFVLELLPGFLHICYGIKVELGTRR